MSQPQAAPDSPTLSVYHTLRCLASGTFVACEKDARFWIEKLEGRRMTTEELKVMNEARLVFQCKGDDEVVNKLANLSGHVGNNNIWSRLWRNKREEIRVASRQSVKVDEKVREVVANRILLKTQIGLTSERLASTVEDLLSDEEALTADIYVATEGNAYPLPYDIQHDMLNIAQRSLRSLAGKVGETSRTLMSGYGAQHDSTTALAFDDYISTLEEKKAAKEAKKAKELAAQSQTTQRGESSVSAATGHAGSMSAVTSRQSGRSKK